MEVEARLEHEITPAEKRDWSAGSAVQWANEAQQIARTKIYGRIICQGGTDAPVVLQPQYARQESAIAAQQLEKTGVRLAAELNRIFR